MIRIVSRHRFPLLPATACLLSLALFAPLSFAAPNYAFFKDGYRGASSVVLAHVNGEAITEQDVFLFLLVSGHPNPGLARDWDSPRWATIREERRRDVARVVRRMAAHLVVGVEEPSHLSPYIEYLSVRYSTYPVYGLVWTDAIVAPQVRIYPEDVTFFIRRFGDEFMQPEQHQFYWAWFPSPVRDSPEDRRQRREQAHRVREDLIASRASLATVAADFPPTTTLLAEDLLYTIAVGLNDLDPLVESAVKDGALRKLSPVVTARDGFHLVEVRNRIPRQSRPEHEIRDEARHRLFHQLLPKQYDHLLEKRRQSVYPVDRTNLWPFLADDIPMLIVGRTHVTKGQFQALFPEITGKQGALNIGQVRARAREVIDGEVVALDVATHFLDEALPLRRARMYAYANHGVKAWRKRFESEQPPPSAEEIQTVLARESETILPATAHRVLRLSAALPAAHENLPEAEFGARLEQMKTELEEFRREAIEVMTAYFASPFSPFSPRDNATASPARHAMDPNPILTRWKRRFGRAYTITDTDLGILSATEPGPFQTSSSIPPRLSLGDMSPPRYEHPGTLAMYFVVEERPRPGVSPEEARRQAARAIRDRRMDEALLSAFHEAKETGRFSWAPDLETALPESWP